MKPTTTNFPDTTLDRRAWEMAGDAEGEHISSKAERSQKNKQRLKGVQLRFGGGPLAYYAESHAGLLVLCDAHLDKRRADGWSLRLTGKAAGAGACDDCPEEKP